MNNLRHHARRVGVAIGGVAVLIVGVIAIPYPGPGWLIVFVGLAILGTEFVWARRVLYYVREKYDTWGAWVGRQHLVSRLFVMSLTGLVMLLTMWLLNVFGVIDETFHFRASWLHSPFGIFYS